MSQPILHRTYPRMADVPEPFLGLYTAQADGTALINDIPGLIETSLIEGVDARIEKLQRYHEAQMIDARARADGPPRSFDRVAARRRPKGRG